MKFIEAFFYTIFQMFIYYRNSFFVVYHNKTFFHKTRSDVDPVAKLVCICIGIYQSALSVFQDCLLRQTADK